MERIKKLTDMLSEDEGILITNPKNAFYFSGIKSSNISLYITKNKKYLITDFRYYETALKNRGGFKVLWEKKLTEYISKIITEKTVYVETDYLTYDNYLNIKNNTTADLKKCGDMIKKLRIIKDDKEIENIKMAQSIADRAFEAVLDSIKPGITEIELKRALEYNMAVLGSPKTAFDTIVLFGKNTSLPHGEPSDNKLLENDIILMDFGCVYNGYCSDITRTFFIGKPSEKMLEAYDDVLYAHKFARDSINLLINAGDVDRFARDYLYEKGYEGLFGHALGHGVGLDVHESPTLSPKSKDILEKNMIFSIEPGVYFNDSFGIRIEDLYYINEEGKPVSFTSLSKKLLII